MTFGDPPRGRTPAGQRPDPTRTIEAGGSEAHHDGGCAGPTIALAVVLALLGTMVWWLLGWSDDATGGEPGPHADDVVTLTTEVHGRHGCPYCHWPEDG